MQIMNTAIQINQPTRCNNFSSLLRDVYVYDLFELYDDARTCKLQNF